MTLLVSQTRVKFAALTYRFVSTRPWGRGGNGEVRYDIVVVHAHRLYKSEGFSETLVSPGHGSLRFARPVSLVLGGVAVFKGRRSRPSKR